MGGPAEPCCPPCWPPCWKPSALLSKLSITARCHDDTADALALYTPLFIIKQSPFLQLLSSSAKKVLEA